MKVADQTFFSRFREKNTRNVLQMAVGFLCVFSAFISQGYIEESVLNTYAEREHPVVQKHDGYTSLSIVYISFTVCNLLAAPIINFLGPRWGLVFGSSMYVIFQCGFLFVNKWFLYVSSALLGLGAAVFWTSNGRYIAINSTKESGGFNSAIALSIGQSSQLWSGIFLLVIFLVTGTDENTAIGFSDSTIHILYGVFVAISIVGVLILALLRVPSLMEEKNIWKISAERLGTDNGEKYFEGKEQADRPEPMTHLQMLRSTFQLALTPRFAIYAVVAMQSGMALSYWSSIYPTSIINTIQFHTVYGWSPKVLLALNAIVQGIGDSGGCFIVSLLDKWICRVRNGRGIMIALSSLIQLCCFVGAVINLPWMAPLEPTSDSGLITPSIPIAMICALFLGIGMAFWRTQTYAFIIAHYPTKNTQAFALGNFFECLLTFAAFYYSKTLKLQWHCLILCLGTLLGGFAFNVLSTTGMSDAK